MFDISELHNCSVEIDFPMKKLNTWKVGGACKYYIIPKSIEDIIKVKKFCIKNKLKLIVIGNGSNVLINDNGFDGVVLHVGKGLKSFSIKENHLYVEAGVMMPKLAFSMVKEKISGFEFYAGIPGTIGGAIVMNAGCLGKQTSSILESVTYISKDGSIITKSIDELNMGYRYSYFQEDTSNIIVSATFKIDTNVDVKEIEINTRKAADIRKDKFPTNVATAGSTFKSPPGGPYPGQLIEEIGLKGFAIGDAHISDIHGNWIINNGQATADDIKKLIVYVTNMVREKKGIELEPEVIYV